MENNIHNGSPFDGKYEPQRKSYFVIFGQLSPFSRYSDFKIRHPENVGQMTYSIRNGAIPRQMPELVFNDNGNVCSIFHRLRDIRISRTIQKLALKTKVGANE